MPDAPTPELRAVRCDACGASIPLGPLDDAVDCTHCGHRQEFCQQMLQELRAYADRVQRSVAATKSELASEGNWQTTGRRSARSTRYAALVVALFLLAPPLLAHLLELGQKTGVLFGGAPTPVVVFLLYGSSYGGAAIYYVAYCVAKARRKAPRVDLGAISVVCSNCGAPNLKKTGEAVAACGHCGDTLASTAPAIERGRARAASAHRHARLKRYRAERIAMLQARAANFDAIPTFAVLGPLSVFFVFLGGLGSAYLLVTGEPQLTLPVSLAAGGALGTAASAWLWLRHKKKRQAFHHAATVLAQPFDGYVTHDLAHTVAWLNGYWAASYAPGWLWSGPFFSAVTLNAGGYPTLVDFEPSTHRDDTTGVAYLARLHVVVAATGLASTRTKPAPTPNSRELWRALRGEGFQVTVTESGILARANVNTLMRAVWNPDELRRLVGVIRSLTELTKLLGGQPPEGLGRANTN